MRTPKQPENVRPHQLEDNRGLSRAGGAASEAGDRIEPDKGSRYVDSISRELASDDPDVTVISPGYSGSGAFSDTNPVYTTYGHEGEGSDPRALRHEDFHPKPWPGPKGRKGK
jgi:hypothetical protein